MWKLASAHQQMHARVVVALFATAVDSLCVDASLHANGLVTFQIWVFMQLQQQNVVVFVQ